MTTSTIVIIVAIVAFFIMLSACLSIANYGGERFFAIYRQMEKIKTQTGLNTFEFFNDINDKYFNGAIKVGEAEYGKDAYVASTLLLSNQTRNSESLASLSIIAHELGHALQDFNSLQIRKHSILRIIGRIIGHLMFPLIIAGIVLLFFGNFYFIIGVSLLGVAVAIFLFAIILKALTIRIEKGASNNAIMLLKQYLLPEEVKKCKKFLNSARLTYWADLFRTMFSWTFLTRKTKTFK